MPGPPFLSGERVTLRPPEREDVSFLRTHEQHPQLRASRSVHEPVDEERAARRVGGTMGRDGDTLALLVCVDEEPVGLVYLIRETPTAALYRTGELAYWTVPEAWGEGYATAGSLLLLEHAFDELGLHRVAAETVETNDASQRVLEKLGFVREGADREKALVDGEWTDTIRYGLLATEWRES